MEVIFIAEHLADLPGLSVLFASRPCGPFVLGSGLLQAVAEFKRV